MRRLAPLVGLSLSACVSIADPSEMDTPRTPNELARDHAINQRYRGPMLRLQESNRDLCPPADDRCVLRWNINTGDGIGAVTTQKESYFSFGFFDFAKSDNEVVLVVAHEWAHRLLQHPPQFVPAQELAADCLGAVMIERAGFDAIAGLEIHRRVQSAQTRQQIGLAFLGIIWTSGALDWDARINIITKAAQITRARKKENLPIDASAIDHICSVKL